MFNNFILIFSIVALLLSSCTSSRDKTFEKSNHKIENQFEIKDEKIKKLISEKPLEVEQTTKSKKIVSSQKKFKEQLKKLAKKAKKRKSIEESKKSETKKKESKDSKLSESKDSYPFEFAMYDEKSILAWNNFKPFVNIGEEFTFLVSYIGISAGHVRLQTLPMVQVQNKPAYRFKAQLRSSRYYSFIYKLDDWLESVVLAENFLPVKFSLIQRETKQDVDDLQVFDLEKNKTFVWYKRIKNEKEKKYNLEKDIPNLFQDSFSSLHFVRGLSLEVGKKFEFPVVARGKVWILKLNVEKKETISVLDQDIEAFRISAVTQFPGVLKKKGDISFWYSADKSRRLLKFEGKIKIGSVKGELVEYKAGKKL